jgi:hypothetical protein
MGFCKERGGDGVGWSGKRPEGAGGKLGFALVGLGGLGVDAAGWAWPAGRLFLLFLLKGFLFSYFPVLF